MVASVKGNWVADGLAFHCTLFYFANFMSYIVLPVKKTSCAHTRKIASDFLNWDITLKNNMKEFCQWSVPD